MNLMLKIKYNFYILLILLIVSFPTKSFTDNHNLKEVIELIDKYEGNLVGVGVIVDRSLAPVFIHDNYFSVTTQKAQIFDKDNIPENLKNVPAIKPGSNTIISDAIELD